MNRFEWSLAIRYLRARREEGFISVIAWFSLLGIALGVATLIIVMSVMNGFRGELLGRVLGLNGHIMVRSIDGPMRDHEQIARQAERAVGVRLVAPIIEAQAMATANGRATGALVRGMRAEDFAKRRIILDGIIFGDAAGFARDGGIVIGDRLAQKLGVRPGQPLSLVAPATTVTPFGAVPRIKTYTIAATFHVGMFEYDSSFVFMPLESAQKHFRFADAVSGIEVFVLDPDKVDVPRREMQAMFGPRFSVVDWQRVHSHFFNALQVERNVMFLILTLIILVAAFNIISGMIMLVKDKEKAIAILRTMGASRASILRVFLIAGASIGIIGTVLGLILGTAFCANIETIRQLLERLTGTELFAAEIYFLSRLPADMDPLEVSSVVLMGLVLSLLATLYPSWRAARTDPVEALRYV